MKNFALTEIDSEDFEDFIFEVEKSLQLKFEYDDFINIKTYGDFSEIVINKITGETDNYCTSQQLFNRLRLSFKKLSVDPKTFNTKTELDNIFPRKNRRKSVKIIEDELGFKLNILTPKNEIKGFIVLTFLLLCVSFFYYNWKVVFLGFGLLYLFSKLVYHFGKELKVKNVTELVEKVTKENYKNSRKSQLYNKQEVEILLEKWFAEKFSLELEMAN